MNNSIQKIDEEEILFFDSEIVRANENLEIGSEEYFLYRKKTRDRDDDEYLSDEDLLDHYNKKAALKMCYNKVVTIGVGFIKNNKVYIKALRGEEADVIKEFCELSKSFKYVSGANIISFDLPMICNNGWKYFNVPETLPDKFNPNGKKPWELKNILDVMNIFKGTHYSNSSVEEICYHLGIPTPKDDISGSEVSEVYYKEGLDRILQYVKKDVLANVNIFRKMQDKDIFNEFIDRDDIKPKEIPILVKLYNSSELTEELKKEIKDTLSKKKIFKKDIKNLERIILAHHLTKGDKVAVKKAKKAEVEQFLKTL